MALFRLILTVLCLCFSLAWPLHAQDSVYELEGYVKTKPLQYVSPQVLTFVEKLGVSKGKIALPSIILGLLGHPTYPGLSKDHNLGLFSYDKPDESDPKFVVIARFEKEDPVRKVIPMFGWSIQDRGDWTLLSKTPEAFALVRNLDQLTAIIEKPMISDIELGYFFGHAVKHAQYLKGKFYENKDLMDANRHAIDFLSQIFPHFQGIALGVDFHETDLSLSARLQANPKTPEYAFLSQKIEGTNKVSRYLAQSNFYAYAGQFNNLETQKYLTYVVENLKETYGKEFSENGQKVFPKLQEWLVKAFNQSNGSFAHVANFKNREVHQVSILGGTFTEASAFNLFEERYRDIYSPLFAEYDKESWVSTRNQFTWQKDFLIQAQTPVHHFIKKVFYKTNLTKPVLIEDTYFSVVRGNCITASHVDSMKEVLDDIVDQEAPLNNLDELFPEMLGVPFYFYLNLGSTVRYALNNYNAAHPQVSAVDQPIAPLIGRAMIKNGLLSLQAKVPYETLSYVFKAAAEANTPAAPQAVAKPLQVSRL